MVGNFVEWFDYGVYGYLATVIARVFFPSGDGSVALLSTFGAFAISFVARPLGGVIGGRLADRHGRRRVLAFTVLLMSAATALIGLVPSYGSIGAAAPCLLVVLRLVQGLAAGGEYAGAVSFVVEYGPRNRRALYASFVSVSVFLGLLTSSLLASLLTSALGPNDLDTWGWRVAFVLAAPLGLIGLYLRARAEDTPEFQHVVAAGKTEAAPLRTALRTQWPAMAIFFGFTLTTAVGTYVFSTYLTSYMIEQGGLSESDALIANTAATLVLIPLLVAAGWLTDRIGRKPMLVTGAVTSALLAVPGLQLAGYGGFVAGVAASLTFVIPQFFIAAPVTVSIAEMFPAPVRVTAGAIAYNLAFTVFGGTAPFVCAALVDGTGDPLAPAYYLVAVSVVSALVSVLGYRERFAERHTTPVESAGSARRGQADSAH
ncbi:MFS transporter [Streptomyces sp. NPDC001661]